MKRIVLGHIPSIEGWWGGISLFKISDNDNIEIADIYCRNDEGKLIEHKEIELDKPYLKHVMYLPDGTTSVIVECSDFIVVNGFCGETTKPGFSFVPLEMLKNE